MELKNSYIFLKNHYKKQKESTLDNVIYIEAKENVSSYIKKAFPDAIKVDNYDSFYKEIYTTEIPISKNTYEVQFVLTTVSDIIYVDIFVKGKTKLQIINCLELVQETLLSSGVRQNYIDIISYDAVSEYYCNKIYPKLNVLERNLRKLLFNIYTLNFGYDYYKTTVTEDLQGKMKSVINIDSTTEGKDKLKTDFNAKNKKEAMEVAYLQKSFYALEYIDIENLLFIPKWTDVDETEKSNFLMNILIYLNYLTKNYKMLFRDLFLKAIGNVSLVVR